MTALSRLLRGHPPSPPQSPPAGDIGSDAQAEFCGITHMAGSQSFSSPPSFYLSDNEYPQMMSIPRGVNTPPLTTDDTSSLSRRRSSPPRWSSPAPRSVPMSVQGKVRVTRPTRTRRRRSRKDRPDGEPELPGPLSELTKHLTHIPVRDMEALVNRPTEVRRQEAIRKGKVVRPMNSFMLYRSAYTERTKEWCSQNNHQVVSRVCGQSWPLEPAAVREKYELLALRERDNHHKAHPDYKFAPVKGNGSSSSKKTQTSSVVNDGESTDFDDLASSSSFMDNRRSTEIDRSFASRDSSPFDTPDSSFAGSYHSSPWQMVRSIPSGLMTPPEPTHHYLQPSVHPSFMGSQVEDVRFRRVGLQELQFNSSSALAGLPGGTHHDLLQPQTSAPAPGHSGEGQLDPQLLTFHQNGPANTGVGGQEYSSFQYMWQEDPATNCYLPLPAPPLTPNTMQTYHPLNPSYQPDMHAGAEGRDAWDLTHEATFEDSKEFEHWFDPQPSGF